MMGRVTVPIRLDNLQDLWFAQKGLIPPEQVRFVEIPDALVDTGATNLCLPKRYIDQLGLDQFTKRPVRTAAGPIEVSIYGTVRLTVQGRVFNGDVAQVSDDCPALLGQVPLEVLDFIIDPVGQKLIGNPAHGGVQMMEIYQALSTGK